MKKLMCVLGHPQRLMKVTECDIEDFENDKEEIQVYKCKHCGWIVGGRTELKKIQKEGFNFDNPSDYL